MAKLVKNPIEYTPHTLDLFEYDALSEVVETNLRGKYVISVLCLQFPELDHPIFSVELWLLPEWMNIEDTSYTGATQLDQATYATVEDALTCHSDSIIALVDRPIVI